MSTYYPSLDEFWPAVRARNFVKALGGVPTKYVENMEFLAARAGVHPTQMLLVNPITFAERNCISSVRTLLGDRTYFTLDMIRKSNWHPSTKWFYANNEPIPPHMGLVALAAKPTSSVKEFVWTAADEARHQANLAQRRADAWARCSAAATESKWGAAPEAEANAMTLLSSALAEAANAKAEVAEIKEWLAQRRAEVEVKEEEVEVKAEDKEWGTRPYITDEDLDKFLEPESGMEGPGATHQAIWDLEFFIRTRGIATYMALRRLQAEKGYFMEEVYGNACSLRPFPIDLHSEEGLAAFAAGKPLPHPVYLREKQQKDQKEMTEVAEVAEAAKAKPVVVKVKSSWWSRPWLCGMVSA
jgi:hypothetical protein